MQNLNFPKFEFNIIEEAGERMLYDSIRKKYVVLTPEEWVRQHVVRFLVEYKNYPETLIQIEGCIKVGKLNKRCDIIVFNKQMKPVFLVECKRPDVEINQKVFDQILRYNLNLGVRNMMVTNGRNHYCFSILPEEQKIEFLKDIPDFEL